MNSITQQLADFVARTGYDDLPEPVVREAKLVILDSTGCALAGRAVDKGRISVELARRLGGTCESSIIGTGDLASSANAAFATGELITALDFDAIVPPAIHVSPFVLPPAMALGESRGISGKELIVAVVLGHEISSRVASGLSGTSKFVRSASGEGVLERLPVHGYSANAFGSAASAGKVLGLDSGRMANCFGIAGYNAPVQAGTQRNHSGTDSMIKWASAGWTARMGTTAALLAESGYTGDVTVLDGDYSFWRFAGSEEWRPQDVIRNLGQEWHILKMHYKRYPCCGVIIPSLELFIAIMNENRLDSGEIREVKVWLDPAGGMPLWQNRQIDNEVQAQFSVAYNFAVAAHRIAPGVEWQAPVTMHDPEIRRFMDKVSAAVHPDYQRPALKPPAWPRAAVTVVAGDAVYTRESSGSFTPGQEPVAGNDATKERFLVDKFKRNASGVLAEAQTDEALRCILALEEVQDIRSLARKLSPGPGTAPRT
ncbi:MAG: MmgE/PrpD family protein [Chloroflexi bacterium]|nr:MmgE/PrpD family protein [Chloroflexota bacterium]